MSFLRYCVCFEWKNTLENDFFAHFAPYRTSDGIPLSQKVHTRLYWTGIVLPAYNKKCLTC